MHALMLQDHPEQKACMRVCIYVTSSVCVCKCVRCYWLSVHSPSYLFAHSAVDRPVRVGKGREEASSLLYC